MGDVYLAHDPNIDRLVAVKTVRVIGGNDEDIADRRGRLLREARAAGRFQHPNVVALYDAGEAAGLLYLAFEYVPGQDLLKRARQSPEMTLREVLRVVRETASALDYAWHRNVVHRDIKPSNILLGPKGEAKVADFGIAKLQNQSVELTRTGSVVGSPQYMSPEQIRGEELDGRSDIFSLGVVFYELLSRTRPFGGDTISTLVFEILAKEPMPIESLRPGLSQGLVQLVRSMMVKDRNQRIADAGLVVQAIEKLEREIPAAELDSPASQATGADVQPTVLMPSGAAAVPSGPVSPLAGSGASVLPPPYPTGSNASAPGSVPMGAPLPSGPLAPMPSGPLAPMASGAGSPGLAGPPVPPPGWGAPQPGAAMTPPPMAQHPPGPPQPPVPPPAYSQTAPPAYAQPPVPPPPSYGQQPPQPYGQNVPPPHGHPQQAYGAQAPRPNYPSAKPTSPLKLLLLLGGLGLFGLIGIVVLVVMLGDDTTPKTTPDPTTASSEAPPPPPDGSSEAEPLVTATVQTGPISESPSDTTTEPTWNEPRPTTPPESTDSGDTAEPAPTPPPRNPGSGRQNDGGGALARLGEAIGADDPAAGGDSTDSGDTTDVADTEPSPRPRIPVPETNSAWQTAAASANSEMETGLRFQFKVTPPEAKVLFWPRDDRRAIVQGSAGEFDPKKDEDARVLELPDDGEYLILLRHGDYPDHVIHVHADRSRGQRPKLLQLSLGRGGGGGSGNTASSIKVSRGVSFAGTPGDAYVFVNGRAQGRASDYPGGEKRSAANLKLDRGKHVVRLEAAGFKPLEIRVEVGSGAPAVEQITYRLEKE